MLWEDTDEVSLDVEVKDVENVPGETDCDVHEDSEDAELASVFDDTEASDNEDCEEVNKIVNEDSEVDDDEGLLSTILSI